MVLRFSKLFSLLALLFLNHIASFTVTAAVLIWFETVFPWYGEAPSLWVIILPLRTAITYTLHHFFDHQTARKTSSDGPCCGQCRHGPLSSPIFSLAVATAFQAVFYEPRWICAVLGVSDEGPMCSLPQAIILEIPLGFTLLVIADHARSIQAHHDIASWAIAHCSPRSLSLQLLGFAIAMSCALTRYERLWSIPMDLFKGAPSIVSLTLLACLVQIESQLITTALSHLERRVWAFPEKHHSFVQPAARTTVRGK